MTAAPALHSLDKLIGMRSARRLRELAGTLTTLDALDGPRSEGSFFASILDPLRDLLETEAIGAYGLRQGEADAHELTFSHFLGPVPYSEFVRLFSGFLSQSDGVTWGAYNAGRPEPAQRNRVISFTSRTMVEEMRLPIAVDLFPKLGVGGKTQVRALLCDGPALLGWIGIWQSSERTAREAGILRALAPAIRRRLRLERRLSQGSRLAAFDAVLEALGQAAFLVDAHGRIREANRIGREMVDTDGRALRTELLSVVRASRSGLQSRTDSRWDATLLRAGSSVAFLVLERARPGAQLFARAGRAAAVWGLTPRQREVLERVAEGNANRTVAAILGISERTVEVHVTALLDKAQVECRAELIARLHALE